MTPTSRAVLSVVVSGALAGCATGTSPATREAAPAATSSSPAPAPRPSPLPPLAIIESLAGGYEFARSPEAEEHFRARPETADTVVRSLVRNGSPVALVAIQDLGEEPSPQDLRNLLAGAADGGAELGTSYRTGLRGYPAIETVLERGKTWSVVVGQYFAIVSGPDAGVADDVGIQVVRRLALLR